jgi:hypothetical protein
MVSDRDATRCRDLAVASVCVCVCLRWVGDSPLRKLCAYYLAFFPNAPASFRSASVLKRFSVLGQTHGLYVAAPWCVGFCWQCTPCMEPGLNTVQRAALAHEDSR